MKNQSGNDGADSLRRNCMAIRRGPRRDRRLCDRKKNGREEERETCVHSTLAVDNSWPFFLLWFLEYARLAAQLTDSDDKEPVL
jgi:hypothetical protein